jgi:hypothetical protein
MAGQIRFDDDPILKSWSEQSAAAYDYLRQDQLWLPNGRPAVRIADMDREWRYNASRWLERRAEYFEARYTFGEILALSTRGMRAVVGEVGGVAVEAGPWLSHFDLMGDHARDAFEAAQDERRREPAAWIRTTPLYRALVAGLPTKRKTLARLAERAAHWSHCRIRRGIGEIECTCHLSECAIRNGHPELGCTCRDNSPD